MINETHKFFMDGSLQSLKKKHNLKKKKKFIITDSHLFIKKFDLFQFFVNFKIIALNKGNHIQLKDDALKKGIIYRMMHIYVLIIKWSDAYVLISKNNARDTNYFINFFTNC